MAVASLAGVSDQGKFTRYVDDQAAGSIEFRWQPTGALENRLTSGQTRVTTVVPGANGEWERITIAGPRGTLDLRRDGNTVRYGDHTLTLPPGALLYGPPALLRIPAALYDVRKGGVQRFPVLFLPDQVTSLTVERLDSTDGFTRYRYGLPASDIAVWIDVRGRVAMSRNLGEGVSFVREGYESLWDARDGHAPFLSLKGRWQGAVTIGGRSLRLVVEMRRDTAWTGELISLDQGGVKVAVTDASFDAAGKVRIAFANIRATIEGTLGANSEIAAQWKQDGGAVPLTLRRTTATFATPAAEPVKAPAPSVPAGDAVERYVRSVMEQRGIPGVSVAVARGGKLLASQAWGMSNVEHSVAATPDTVYLLASITKMFTATAILQLAEEDKLQLDDPVSKHLSGTPEAWRGITIRRLLTHTAGLKDRFEQEDLSPAAWKLNYTTPQLYDAARRTPTDFVPGAGWQYSDQGYFLLGMIVEHAAGASYRDYLKHRIFDPLGMSAAGIVDQNEIMPHLASGYTIAGGKLRPNRRTTEFGMVSHFGVIATAADLVKFDPAKLLLPATLTAMRTPVTLDSGPGPMLNYGFGCFLERFHGHRIVQHGGSTGTAWLHLPDDDLTVVVLTNLELLAGGDAPGMARRVAAEYVPDLAWSSFRPAADPHPARTQFTKESLQQILAGRLEANRYTEPFRAAMQSQLATYQAAATKLGTLNDFEWLFTDEASSGRTVERYRAMYQRLPGPLFVEATFEKDGRIAHLTTIQEP
jgi:CubicO group peptidase (beta-lactamase class C family)